MLKRLTILTYCLVFAFLTASGQDNVSYVVRRNSSYRAVTPSSLSSYTVNAMAQDNRGLLWLGTVNGLFYFDNYNFTNYNCDNFLNSMICSLLCVGDSLMIGTERGVSIVNVGNGAVSNLLTDRRINVMRGSCSQKVLIGTDDGLFQFDGKNGSVTEIELENADSKLNVNNITYIAFRKEWWVATDKGVFCEKDGRWSKFNDAVANVICVFDENHIYIGTDNGLYLVDNEADSLKQLPIETGAAGMINPVVSDIIVFDDDEIMIATNGNGIFRLNVFDNSHINITRYGSVEMSLSDDYITMLFKDSFGRYWIATALGINNMIPDYSNFTSFSLYNGSTHNLPVRSIAQVADNELFMGTDDGVFVFNKTKNSYNSFEDYYGLDDNRIASVRVGKVFYDRDRYLWVGTRYKGVFCFDTKMKRFFDWLPDFSHQIINDITDDRHGGIWVATSNGVLRIDIQSRSYKKMYEGAARGLLYDDDFMYVTAGRKLLRFAVHDGSCNAFEVDEDNDLYNITKGKDDKLYIGSYHGGVINFDLKTLTFSTFKNEKDGVSPIAYSILFDNDDNVWVSSNLGIWTYNERTKAISTFNVSDGLQGNDFTMNGAMKDNSGMMYFGGFNGFSMFNPLNIKQEKTEPQLIVTKVHTSLGIDILNIHDNDTLLLKSDENTFVIDYSACNLYKINKIQYQYILEGYDKQWSVSSSANHHAEYRNLPAGTYTFLLIASNEANVTNRNPFRLTITVKPVWYGTILFKVVVTVFAMIIISLVIFSRIRKARREIAHAREINELERKMFMLKGKALQMQMNPHFLYNTLNSIQSFIITNDSVNASLYLSSFAKLMRKILNNASRDKVKLSEELESIRLYLDLEMLRLNNRFVYRIIVDPEIQADKIEIASMLLQPFAENAVIHGLAYKASDGLLTIALKRENNNIIKIVIEDNGIGRVKAARIRRELGKTEESHATSITKQRLEILNEVSKGDYSVKIIDLYNDAGEATGTRVEIKMSCHD